MISKTVLAANNSHQHKKETEYQELQVIPTSSDLDLDLWCDDGVHIPTQAILLAASSPLLAVLISRLYQSPSPRGRVTLHLPDVESDVVKTVLQIISSPHNLYSGVSKLEIVEILLDVAKFYEFTLLSKNCFSYLRENINDQTCIRILQLAKYHQHSELEQAAFNHIRANFCAVSEKAEIAKLDYQTFYNLLSSDYLDAYPEYVVYRAILSWVGHFPDRRCHFPQLFSCIRLGYLTLTEVQTIGRTCPYLTTACSRQLLKASTYLKSVVEDASFVQHNFHMDFCKPRVPRHVLFVIGGWTLEHCPTNLIETHDMTADQWFSCHSVECQARAYQGTAVVGTKIFVIGGFNGFSYLNTVAVFDADRSRWEKLACMHERRCYINVTSDDEDGRNNGDSRSLYACGGFNGILRLASAERYDINRNQWEMVASMNSARSDAGISCLNKKVYVVGGYDGNAIISSAEVYDPETNAWTLIASMREGPRSGLRVCTWNGCIYTVGGNNGAARVKTVECYNPSRDSWSRVPDLPSRRSNCAIAVVDGYLMVIGGYNGSSVVDTVECFDGSQWLRSKSMTVARSAHTAAVVSGLTDPKMYTYHQPGNRKH